MTATVEQVTAELLSGDKAADPLTMNKKRKLDDGGVLVCPLCYFLKRLKQAWVACLKLPGLPCVVGIRRCSSKYRGVSWHNQTGKWKAQIKVPLVTVS